MTEKNSTPASGVRLNEDPSIIQNLNGLLTETKIRSIIMGGTVNEETSISIIKGLIMMEIEDPDSPIVLFINTFGGYAYDAFAIYDVIKAMKCPIITVACGKVMSAGILIACAGRKGDRYALPNTYFMLHDLSSVTAGSFTQAELKHKHDEELRNRYAKLVCDNSKIKLKDMKNILMTKDTYFGSDQAKELGLIDHIGIKKPFYSSFKHG